jgi:hypothetical protein
MPSSPSIGRYRCRGCHRYDIRINEFFRQDQTYLFRFSRGTVNGEPLLSMQKGSLVFSAALAAGRGSSTPPRSPAATRDSPG